jgi:hypothetical protein
MTVVFNKQFKTLILGEDNAEKTEFVSALTYYLLNNGIASYLSEEKVENLKVNHKINNENIKISKVILKTPHNDHIIFANDDPEMVEDEFLSDHVKKEIVTLLDLIHINASSTAIVFGSTKIDVIKNNSIWMNKIKSVIDFLDKLK